MKTHFGINLPLAFWISLIVFAIVFLSFIAVRSQPAVQPCDEQLTQEMFNFGVTKQQLAITRDSLRVVTKELNDLKARAAAEKK